MIIGSLVFLIIVNIYLEYFKEINLSTELLRHPAGLRYVGDTHIYILTLPERCKKKQTVGPFELYKTFNMVHYRKKT